MREMVQSSFDKYRPIPGVSSPLHKYPKSKNVVTQNAKLVNSKT